VGGGRRRRVWGGAATMMMLAKQRENKMLTCGECQVNPRTFLYLLYWTLFSTSLDTSEKNLVGPHSRSREKQTRLFSLGV